MVPVKKYLHIIQTLSVTSSPKMIAVVSRLQARWALLSNAELDRSPLIKGNRFALNAVHNFESDVQSRLPNPLFRIEVELALHPASGPKTQAYSARTTFEFGVCKNQ